MCLSVSCPINIKQRERESESQHQANKITIWVINMPIIIYFKIMELCQKTLSYISVSTTVFSNNGCAGSKETDLLNSLPHQLNTHFLILSDQLIWMIFIYCFITSSMAEGHLIWMLFIHSVLLHQAWQRDT